MFNIDQVVEGYWESAMWTTHCNGTVRDGHEEFCHGEDCDTSLGDIGLTRDDVAAETWPKIHQVCEEFLNLVTQEIGSELLDQLWEWPYGAEGFGHDLWLTRNRHGAGFWDRGQGELGDLLTKWAHAEGEANLTVGDDGMIYHD